MDLAPLLLCAARWFDRASIVRLHAQGWRKLTSAQTTVFPHLDAGGTRPAELARRLGISRQAGHQLVQSLQAEGFLDLIPDPTNRRSKLVVLTARGRRLVGDAIRIFGELERELASRIGSAEIEELRRILSAEWGPPPGVGEVGAGAARRGDRPAGGP